MSPKLFLSGLACIACLGAGPALAQANTAAGGSSSVQSSIDTTMSAGQIPGAGGATTPAGPATCAGGASANCGPGSTTSRSSLQGPGVTPYGSAQPGAGAAGGSAYGGAAMSGSPGATVNGTPAAGGVGAGASGAR